MTSKRRKMSETSNQQRINTKLDHKASDNTKLHESDYEHSKNLLKILNSMRDDESLCDYEIRVNGKSFYCHKFILIAASDFFKAMLTGCMKESKENYVELKGFHSSIGIKLVLDFIYTGSIDISFENILSVIDSASQLQINHLLELCSDFLMQNLNTMNCVTVLKLADTYSMLPLVNYTNSFISENIAEIYQNSSDQFNQLTYEQIKYLLSNDCLQVCAEIDLFLMIVKWIESSESDANRLKHAADLMKYVRFMNMSAEELADKVESVEFMNQIPECNLYLMNAYKWHALPKRQPLIKNEQTKLRNQEMLVAVGETNIFVLNELKQKWEIVSTAPLEDNYPYPFSVITINNYLYVLGTRRSSSEEYKSCYRFSPRTLEWTPLAPLLRDRSRFGLALVKNQIYIFGGFEGFKRSNRVYLNTIERYSIEDDKWEEFSGEGPLMSCMASTSHNHLIYFGGGKNVNWSKVSDFYSINVETKEITRKANMLTARTTHQLTTLNGLIYLYGGFDEAGNGVLSIESYNIRTDQWSTVTSIPGVLSKTWPQSLGVSNNRFYISVFTTPNTFKIIQKGYYYDIETDTWSDGPVINERARYCPTCCLAFPRNVYNFNNDFVAIKHENTALNEANAFNTSSEIASLAKSVIPLTLNSSSSSAEDDDEEEEEEQVEEIVENKISFKTTTSLKC